MTTTLLAFPMALAMASASWKTDSTALRRFDSSFDMIYGVDESWSKNVRTNAIKCSGHSLSILHNNFLQLKINKASVLC